MFNPPYVPTPSDELLGTGIERSWAGGERGREVLDRLLPQLDDLLSPGGVFYFVVIKENEPDDVKAALKALGMSCESLGRKRAGKEELQILRAGRSQREERSSQ